MTRRPVLAALRAREAIDGGAAMRAARGWNLWLEEQAAALLIAGMSPEAVAAELGMSEDMARELIADCRDDGRDNGEW